MSEIASFYVERVGLRYWAVKHAGTSGEKTLMMTTDEIAAKLTARLLEDAYKDGFEAGLVAQKYFPQEIRAFGYLPANRPSPL